MEVSLNALDQRVRRAAKRVGLTACKARGQQHVNNLGQYMLVDTYSNTVVAGENYGWPAEWVFDFCSTYQTS